MLTADLIRVTRRKGAVYPRYLDVGHPPLLDTARALIRVFEQAMETEPHPRRVDLDEQIADLVEHRSDPLLFRGLCKLLFDRTELEQAAEQSPEELRRALFTAATGVTLRREPGRSWEQKRAEIVASVAAERGLSPEQLEESLYADLPENHRITRFKQVEPVALLQRYNLALAQAVLLRAIRMTVKLAPAEVGAYRQLFRELKFRQLIHTVQSLPDGAYEIEIDGPLSIFSGANRYGLAMALFLPTLVMLDRWWLEAELRWGKEREPSRFSLDHKRGLTTHRRPTGQYVTREQQWLEERFEKKPGPWNMTRSVDLLRTTRGEVVIPDLRFEHGETGVVAQLEILGFWRRGFLERRLEQLDDPNLGELFLAVSSKLAGEKKADPPEHPRVVWFKQVIPVAELRRRLEQELLR